MGTKSSESKTLVQHQKEDASKALAWYPHFYFSYWLFCLDGHAFILALSRPLA